MLAPHNGEDAEFHHVGLTPENLENLFILVGTEAVLFDCFFGYLHRINYPAASFRVMNYPAGSNGVSKSL